MLDEWCKKMDSKQILTKELLRLHQQEAELQLSYDQKMLQIDTRKETILSELLPGYCPNKPVLETLEKTPAKDSQYTFIANGRRLAVQQLSEINKNDFDVILDTTTNSLRFRKDPVRHSKLEQSGLKKVGSHRMQILAHMLEHPGKPFHAGNIGSDLVAGSGERARNTFTKSIAVIRKALDQGNMSEPYLVKRFDWDGITGLKQGCVYKINSERKYLVIRHRKNSGQIPL